MANRINKDCETCIHAGICKHQEQYEKDIVKIEESIKMLVDYDCTVICIGIECRHWDDGKSYYQDILLPNWPLNPVINPTIYKTPNDVPNPYEITC